MPFQTVCQAQSSTKVEIHKAQNIKAVGAINQSK